MYNHHSGKGMVVHFVPFLFLNGGCTFCAIPFPEWWLYILGTKCTTTIQEKEWHKMYNHHSGKGMACTTTIQEKKWCFEWCHFKPLCTKKKTTTYGVRNPGSLRTCVLSNL
jgi:hypothetical protein